ncbi:MAG TPA: hypothetical protein VM513_17395 [Kofleriaceae bacterium]|jgi:hypothetical protein|nr:hypothetical protein [Kofleriaceae bacterium]
MRRAALGLFVLVAWARTSAADPGFLWRAPVTCPSAEEVAARIERRLGGAVDAALGGIEIVIEREHGEFVARIDARAVTVANAVRTLRSRRCDGLADAVSIVLARLASELRDRVRVEPEPAPVVEAGMIVDDELIPGEELVRVQPPASPTPRASARRWGAGLRLVGLSGIGALPGLNVGGELGGYVRRGELVGEAAVAHWAPQRKSLQGNAPAGVVVTLQVLTLRAGWGPAGMPLRAWGTVELGSLSGEGMAVTTPREGAGRWTAVGGGFGVAWPMSPYARLVGSIEVVVPVGTTRFTLEGGTELWRPGVAAARSALGLEVGFQ